VETQAGKNKPTVEEHYAALVYLSADSAETPELLLFEEKLINEPKWKNLAAHKDRQFRERARAKYEQIALELFASDRFVRRLKKFKKISVLLNKPIEPAEVKSKLTEMLRDSSYHHLRWLIVDSVLLPFSLLAAPVPGPNLIGYYLLFRVYSHWKSYRSASQARLDQIDVHVSTQAGEVHDAFSKQKDVQSGLKELRRKFGLRALQEHKFIPQSSAIRESWRKFRESFDHK
jgi:hypothetical protein